MQLRKNSIEWKSLMDHCNESVNWPTQSVAMIEYIKGGTIVAVTSCTNIHQLSP